ncbi:Hypothetical predicted protein, partial [Pelobates cultripes]
TATLGLPPDPRHPVNLPVLGTPTSLGLLSGSQHPFCSCLQPVLVISWRPASYFQHGHPLPGFARRLADDVISGAPAVRERRCDVTSGHAGREGGGLLDLPAVPPSWKWLPDAAAALTWDRTARGDDTRLGPTSPATPYRRRLLPSRPPLTGLGDSCDGGLERLARQPSSTGLASSPGTPSMPANTAANEPAPCAAR